MKDDFPNYDFYKIGCLSYNKIINEPLKIAIEEAGLTGMVIKPFEHFKVYNGN